MTTGDTAAEGADDEARERNCGHQCREAGVGVGRESEEDHVARHVGDEDVPEPEVGGCVDEAGRHCQQHQRDDDARGDGAGLGSHR